IPGLMRRLVGHLQPALLLLTETEFWPGMLKACRSKHIPVVGINTRISDRSFPGYLRTRWLWRRWLAPVSLFLAQSDVDADRLAAIGVHQDNIKVAGNMKYALTAPEVQADALRHRLDASVHRPILVVASTHADEEARILAMLPDWLELRPDLLTVIVPRHPQRFDAIAELIRQRGYHLSRWSDGEDEPAKEIMLIDAMGILAGLYSIADIAFIGGSLIDIGGHNPLEAAICGRGVVTGPYMQNFRAIINDMQHEQAAIVARNDAELRDAICRLIAHPEELQSLHQNAIAFMAERTQVLPRILEAIRPLLPEAANKT
ncbi:MAG: glycosyltransferase N-terminal domain-containing protein, partial [Mariprofundaceae bacterium]